ncbi:DinB family protein [Sediminibacterium sp.]|uniref:DinB family protein n=1 Tax=Sediminibacterium sp. TaxID=1917865 RepID=UPI003F6F8DBB
MPKPSPEDYPPFFEGYINQIEHNNIREAVNHISHPLTYFFLNLPDDKGDYAYARDKWTLKDMLQHIIDTERIMQYRLLRIARKDITPLPGFDENFFALQANASARTFISLKEELKALRKSTDLLLLSLTDEQLANEGITSNHKMTANAIAYILFGHLMHHKKIVEERYL